MKREKEREEASVKYQMSTRPVAIGGSAFEDMVYYMNINPSFIAGAKWADEHPRKGLVDIDKACEWLTNTTIGTFPYKLIEEFRKAMEE